MLNYWELLEVLATSLLPTLSFYFWLQCDSRTSYLSLLALLLNFVLPLVCFLESLQDQMLLLLRLMESTTMSTGSNAGEFCTVCQSDIGRASVCARTGCKHTFHMWCLWAMFRSARGDQREDHRVKEIRCPNCNGQL